jgi:hypothetical protein
MRLPGIPDLLPQVIIAISALPGQREKSWPKHDLTEGIMTLADDMRSDATLLIGVS